MKRFLTLTLAFVMMMLCVGTAVAEETETVYPYEGAWVTFEDGFAVYLPADWVEVEVQDEWLESGIFYVAASPDGARTVQIAWAEADVTTYEDLQAAMATIYPDATIVQNEDGIQFVTYESAENDVATLIALDATENGMYLFNFTPASDGDFRAIALAIAGSITNVEVDAAAE
jgi:hypothetical protein